MKAFESIVKGIKSFKILKPYNVIDDILKCVELNLPNFISSKEFVDITRIKKNENQHSAALCVFLNFHSHKNICFSREGSQKGSSTIDIVVYAGSKVVFTIEAKILPTPLTSSRRTEQEYVYGTGAGIQRFRDGNHGLDDQNVPLNQSGLIAYIKEEEFVDWHKKINQWIVDASWPKSEALEKLYFNSVARLSSEHIRVDNSTIKLHHFWIKVR